MRAFARAEIEDTPDGMCTLELTLPPDDAGPVLRAWMRAEAELLLEDADADLTNENDPDWRTPDQRRCDAFVRVVMSASSAARRSP